MTLLHRRVLHTAQTTTVVAQTQTALASFAAPTQDTVIMLQTTATITGMDTATPSSAVMASTVATALTASRLADTASPTAVATSSPA